MSTRQNLGFRLIELRRRRMAGANSAPNQPTLSAGTLTSSGATLTGSAFSDPDVGDTHAASQWQVTLAADTSFASPVISTGDDATNKVSYAASGLTASTNYIARVRYKDSAGNYSSYSTSASFTTAAGGTTYTNAIHIATSAQGASVAAAAAFNDLAQVTVAVLVSYTSGAVGQLVGKGDLNTTGYWGNIAADSLLDFIGVRATTSDFSRAAIPAPGSYQWIFLTYNRATNQVSRMAGPKGGAITQTQGLTGGGGNGANVAEAGPFWIGSNGGAAGTVADVQFVGYASSILSLAQAQAIADDALSQSALFVDYWKPTATGGSGTSIPSGKGVLPAMVTSGATVI